MNYLFVPRASILQPTNSIKDPIILNVVLKEKIRSMIQLPEEETEATPFPLEKHGYSIVLIKMFVRENGHF